MRDIGSFAVPDLSTTETMWKFIKANPGACLNDIRIHLGGHFLDKGGDGLVASSLNRLHKMGVVSRWRAQRDTLAEPRDDGRYAHKFMYCYGLVDDKAQSYEDARRLAARRRKQVIAIPAKQHSSVAPVPAPAPVVVETKRQPVAMSIQMIETADDLPIDVESLTIAQARRLLARLTEVFA